MGNGFPSLLRHMEALNILLSKVMFQAWIFSSLYYYKCQWDFWISLQISMWALEKCFWCILVLPALSLWALLPAVCPPDNVNVQGLLTKCSLRDGFRFSIENATLSLWWFQQADTQSMKSQHRIHKCWVCPWRCGPHNVTLNQRWFMLMSVCGCCGGVQQRKERQESLRGRTGSVNTQFSFIFVPLSCSNHSPTQPHFSFFRLLHLYLSQFSVESPSPPCLSFIILSIVMFSVLRRETLMLSWSTGMLTEKEKEDNIYIWISSVTIPHVQLT